MNTPGPILIADRIPALDQKLVELLENLSPEDWKKQTIVPKWKVEDVVLHLLDGNIRILSIQRDGYFGDPPGRINSYDDLLAYLNQLNADWIRAAKRMSPKLVIELLKQTNKEIVDYLTTIDLFAPALFSVAWAGEETSANWFHWAREYTEKWHHQQQIRLALGKEKELYKREWYHPHLETSMRALPHHYRNFPAKKDEVLSFEITGEAGGIWHLYHDGNKWIQAENLPITENLITIEGEIAWRLFTKGIKKEETIIKIQGNKLAGEYLLSMLAVMA
nr:maleylpyruvate isomerase N-terminal domain-containing protein [uncultured Sediminibacterium sp.]